VEAPDELSIYVIEGYYSVRSNRCRLRRHTIRMDGFVSAQAPFSGGEIERVVSWKGNSNLSKLAGTPVRLRFVIKDGDLYSIRFRP